MLSASGSAALRALATVKRGLQCVDKLYHHVLSTILALLSHPTLHLADLLSRDITHHVPYHTRFTLVLIGTPWLHSINKARVCLARLKGVIFYV